MTEKKKRTTTKERQADLGAKRHQVANEKISTQGGVSAARIRSSKKAKNAKLAKSSKVTESDGLSDPVYDQLFEKWEEADFQPEDYMVKVSINSLESAVGYSSLFRQMHQGFLRNVAFYKSSAGGSLSTEEARAKAFHACTDKEAAKKEFRSLMRLPVENLNFADLLELHSFAPKVAERFWEHVKLEGRKEFISGHLTANISFPVGYMKQVWNIARYLGVRESFIDDWKPTGGIEYSLIDMLTQAYFQWQYWFEQTVKRARTKEREQHPEYSRWMAQLQKEFRANGWTDGHWFRPFVSEQQAIEHAVQMADRWNRIYMRTLRYIVELIGEKRDFKYHLIQLHFFGRCDCHRSEELRVYLWSFLHLAVSLASLHKAF